MNPKVFFQTMITLASASLGLLAALAWNEAIKAGMRHFLGEGETLAALFIYAILATAVAVVILLVFAKAASRVGGAAAIEREAEG